MVGVAQLVEHRVVVPVVAGSSPVTHPTDRLGAGMLDARGAAVGARRPRSCGRRAEGPTGIPQPLDCYRMSPGSFGAENAMELPSGSLIITVSTRSLRAG